MAFAISTLTTVINPLQTFRRLPGVSVLTERQWGGFLVFSGLVGIGVGLGAAGRPLGIFYISHPRALLNKSF